MDDFGEAALVTPDTRRGWPVSAAALLALWLVPSAPLPVASQPAQPTKVAVGGVELHYIEQGEGEAVILLHGGQGDYRAWPALIEQLAPRYRVITYSRRYHWPNDNPVTGANHSALVDADDLAGLMRALGLGSAHLVGTSYGAFTALALAVQRPELVRSLVVAEPPVHQWITDTERGAAIYRERVTAVHEPAGRAFAAGHDEAAMRLFIDAFDGRGTFDRHDADRRAAIMANARFFKALTSSSDPFPNLSKDAVRRLPMPMLIVRGADTDELHRRVTQELERLVPAADRLIVPNAGHGSPRQNPRVFNAAVVEFLERQRRRTP